MSLDGIIDALRNVVTPEMDHEVITSTPFLWTTRIVDIISTFILGLIFFAHICSASNKPVLRSMRSFGAELKKWSKALNIFTTLFVLSQFILLLSLSLNIWEIIPTSLSCNTIVIFMVSLYHFSKSSFYCVLITRLQVAFFASSLKYSPITIGSLYLFVIIYTTVVCIGTPFIIHGVWLFLNEVSWCHIHTHNTTLSSISIAVWIMMDVVISVILCWLFMRPIKQVLKGSEDQPNVKFTELYIKYGLLTYISIILNLVSLMFYLFDHLTILIEITAAINCICIVLMYARHQRVFDCLCGWTVVCCMKGKVKRRIGSESTKSKPTESDAAEMDALKSNVGDEDELEDEYL